MNHRKMRKGFGKLGLICFALLICLAGTGVGYAHWSDTVTIEGTITTGEWDCGGTIGFWKNWDSHNTYTEDEIEGWLQSIDENSTWLGPTNMTDMVSWLTWDEENPANNMTNKFLAHYLATRLNMETEPLPRLNPDNEHDITTIKGYGYLGLANPSSATLSEIVQAIEDKHVPPATEPPTDKQFEIMKNICDALNNLEI
ncbi:MAG TPA: SipW-dependent-type signal peptide-containing protein [Dehalococcoidia bacterium]|nr:SipW-dependent-type signal peptide-containing protein [Dehalococcoidia bacterium]